MADAKKDAKRLVKFIKADEAQGIIHISKRSIMDGLGWTETRFRNAKDARLSRSVTNGGSVVVYNRRRWKVTDDPVIIAQYNHEQERIADGVLFKTSVHLEAVANNSSVAPRERAEMMRAEIRIGKARTFLR